MERSQNPDYPDNRWERGLDWLVTLLCWAWFLGGFILFYSWRFLYHYLFDRNPERYFQRMFSQFYRVFFTIIKSTSPRQTIEIDKEVAGLRAGVVISNHLSYLDPLLMISLFERHRTIVKARFFSVPIFGWFITRAGYIPSSSQGKEGALMLQQLENMDGFFQEGGNLFVFPEGTRSRDGSVGPMHKGALKIARMCRAPIYVVKIDNTEKLFTPGKFVFNTRKHNRIQVRLLDRIEPDYRNGPPSTVSLEQRVRQAFSARDS